ncbi:MAG TPA: hypothetical protein VGM75_08135, partial [Pseudonocardiaceae bacterium]
ARGPNRRSLAAASNRVTRSGRVASSAISSFSGRTTMRVGQRDDHDRAAGRGDAHAAGAIGAGRAEPGAGDQQRRGNHQSEGEQNGGLNDECIVAEAAEEQARNAQRPLFRQLARGAVRRLGNGAEGRQIRLWQG